ncbi:MAG: HPr family phosphocarrier protein [Methylococcales bacterium]|jgi:phosphocarrier protein HPr|nr:HPr family phosphocarrier protein [Methylococcales bacterium]MBT7410244.1 HPr family phosphocarrier protein [Methylococcales bacterium]
MKKIHVKIQNKLGLHARAAAKLVKLASQYKSFITLKKGSMDANAKSIMSVMMLAASYGTELKIEIVGEDENEVAQAIQALFNRKFDEES